MKQVNSIGCSIEETGSETHKIGHDAVLTKRLVATKHGYLGSFYCCVQPWHTPLRTEDMFETQIPNKCVHPSISP